MKSVMPSQQHFATVPQIGNTQRSTFDRSKGYKTTFNAGFLIPFLVDEILPADTMNVKTAILTRLATPTKPIMDNLHMETMYFFVPNRILWENWEQFNGYNPDPVTTPTPPDFLLPSTHFDGIAITSIADYMGLPVHLGGQTNPLEVQSMPFRAYNKIYNDWFKDENLIDNATEFTGDGPDDNTQFQIRRRGKKHDYFTSALPWPQKGEAVGINLTGNIPVVGDGSTLGFYDGAGGFAGTVEGVGAAGIATDTGSNNAAVGGIITPPPTNLQDNRVIGVSQNPNDSGLIGMLNGVNAITINDLREAITIQQVLEQDARGGTRYTEFVKSHFGVTVPDFRLQRSEYLGGSSDMININPITQSSPSEIQGPGGDLTPQGNLAATGTGMSNRGGFTKSFTEHGVIIGIVTVRADLTYQNNVERFWRRQTRYDFYLPAFAHLGEQTLSQSEIFYSDLNYAAEPVFGYQERWAEYRYNPSLITGLFRSPVGGHTASLDVWHLSEDFTTAPELDRQFIEDRTDEVVDRVVAIPSEPDFLLDAYFDIKHTRALPMYSVPGLRRL